MFWTSRTSNGPLRTSSSGLYLALAGSVGLNSRQCEKCARHPAVSCQFSPLMSWMTAECGQVSKVGMTRPDALARPGRREAHDMLRSVMAQIAVVQPAEKDAALVMQTGTWRSRILVAQRDEP